MIATVAPRRQWPGAEKIFEHVYDFGLARQILYPF
jgi:hypothetical protein